MENVLINCKLLTVLLFHFGNAKQRCAIPNCPNIVLFFALFLLFTIRTILYYLLFLNRYSRAIPCFAKRHL